MPGMQKVAVLSPASPVKGFEVERDVKDSGLLRTWRVCTNETDLVGLVQLLYQGSKSEPGRPDDLGPSAPTHKAFQKESRPRPPIIALQVGDLSTLGPVLAEISKASEKSPITFPCTLLSSWISPSLSCQLHSAPSSLLPSVPLLPGHWPYLQIIHKFLDFHFGLMHPCYVLETDPFPRFAIHDGEARHFQLVLSQGGGMGTERGERERDPDNR